MYAFKQGCGTFYTGYMGNFDAMFTKAVNELKEKFPDKNIRLICVRPYNTKEFTENAEHYKKLFDSIEYPDEILNIYPPDAIKARNRLLIDRSDAVIIYTERKSGGAHEAFKYAVSKDKTILKLPQGAVL